MSVVLQSQSNTHLNLLGLSLTLNRTSEYSREAIEMAESPVYMLINIMFSDKDAYTRTIKCKFPASI